MTPAGASLSGWKSAAGFVCWLALCFGAASFGARFPPGEWYAGLAKPAWTPPNWLFAPVWTALYVMMATSAWLVWRQGGWRGNRAALGAFLGQLVLNALWSWLFFGRQNPGLAFADITALWLGIVATIVLFRRSHRLAAALLGPYLAWVSFAAVLNFALWRLNAG